MAIDGEAILKSMRNSEIEQELIWIDQIGEKVGKINDLFLQLQQVHKDLLIILAQSPMQHRLESLAGALISARDEELDKE